MTAVDGLVIVDKPGEWTSHDVVGRMRRLAGTRKVGHAGTLDPMAIGVLICGIGKATRLLGLIADKDKTYDATIRLGATTNTDDVDGELAELTGAGPECLDSVKAEIAKLTGDILQRPSAVSAIKIDGKRAYKLVREGKQVELPERPVTVSAFELHSHRLAALNDVEVLDLDVTVSCSTGTYIRALARDLGAALGVGGHLTSLRRTRVGPFGIDSARTLEELAEEFSFLPLDEVSRSLFPVVTVTDEQAKNFSHGGRLPLLADTADTIAVFSADAELLGLAKPQATHLAPTVVWTGPRS